MRNRLGRYEHQISYIHEALEEFRVPYFTAIFVPILEIFYIGCVQ